MFHEERPYWPSDWRGALAATGAIAQTKQADKDSQTFIKAAIQGDIADSRCRQAGAGERPE